MLIGELFVDVIPRLDSGGLSRQMSSAVKDASSDAEKSGKNLGGKVAKGLIGGFAAVWAGGKALDIGKDIFGAAAGLEQLQKKSATVFGDALGDVQKWAKGNASAMGQTTNEVVGMATSLGDLLIPMGFTRKEAGKMSTDIVGLAGALSQWSGGTKSASEVSDILTAAMLGETDGLKALGISISAAEIQAVLAAKGQDKLTGSALAQAQAMATQQLIMEKSTDAQAAFSAGGSPLLAAQAKIKSALGEVKDSLLAGLIPALSVGASWFAEHLPGAIETGKTALGNIWDAFTGLKDLIVGGDFTGALRDAFGWEEDSGIVDFILDVRAKFLEVTDWLKTNVPPALDVVKGAFKDAVSAATPLVKDFYDQIKEAIDWISNNWGVIVSLSGALAAFAVTLAVANEVKKFVGIMRAWSAATAIQTGLQWLLNSALLANPIGLIIAAIVGLIAGLVLLYQNSETFRDIVNGVWESVKAVVMTVVTWLTETAMPAIVTAWNTVKDAIVGVWEQYIKPVWDAFAAVVSWLWNTVLAVIFLAIKIEWVVLSTAISWAWENVIKPVFEAFSTVVQWLWKNVLKPYFDLIKAGWDILLTGMKWVWDNVLAPVFKFFGDQISGLKGIFDIAVEAIGIAWDKLKEIAKAPIKFVIDTIINDGLIDTFNKVADFFDSKRIQRIPLPKGFRGGGYTGDGDANQPAGVVHAGEYVFTKEQTRKLGVGNLSRMARGYKGGGFVGDLIEGAKDAASNIASFAKDPAGAIRKAVEDLFSGIGDSDFAQMALSAPKSLLNSAIETVKGFLGFGGGSGGGASGLMGFAHELQSMGVRISEHPLFGGVTPGGHMVGSKHYSGRAFDANYGAGTSAREQAFFDNVIAQGMAKKFGVKTLWRVPGHFNHLHAEYDNGGWLQKGRTMTANNTGKPEAVLTAEQWATMKALASGGNRNGPLIGTANISQDVDLTRIGQELDFKMRTLEV